MSKVTINGITCSSKKEAVLAVNPDAHIKSGRQNGCLKNCKVQTKALPMAARNTRKHGQHAKATTDLGTFVPE